MVFRNLACNSRIWIQSLFPLLASLYYNLYIGEDTGNAAFPLLFLKWHLDLYYERYHHLQMALEIRKKEPNYVT